MHTNKGCMHTPTCTRQACIHTDTHTDRRTCTHTDRRTCTHINTHNKHNYRHTHRYTHTYQQTHTHTYRRLENFRCYKNFVCVTPVQNLNTRNIFSFKNISYQKLVSQFYNGVDTCFLVILNGIVKVLKILQQRWIT